MEQPLHDDVMRIDVDAPPVIDPIAEPPPEWEILGNEPHVAVTPSLDEPLNPPDAGSEPPPECNILQRFPQVDVTNTFAEPGTSPSNPLPSRKSRRIDPAAQRRGALAGSKVAAERRREDAESWVEDCWPLWMIVLELRAEGKTLAQIAAEFTANEYETPQGRTRWHPAQVARILRRVIQKADEFREELLAALEELTKVVSMDRGKKVAGKGGKDGEDEEAAGGTDVV